MSKEFVAVFPSLTLLSTDSPAGYEADHLPSRVWLQHLRAPDSLAITITVATVVYFVFHRFEPSGPVALVTLLIFAPSILAILLSSLRAWVTFSLFYSTVLSLVAAYRLGPFHSLSKVPGPRLNALSQFRVAQISSRGKMHLYYQELHRKYGPIVRVGPNEVSIADADAIQPVLGANGWPKGPNWDGRLPPMPSKPIIAIHNAREHHRRRIFWNRGFSSAALQDYASIIRTRILQLAERLRERGEGDKPVDLGRWLNFFTYDFMGDMVFGGGTDMLNDEDKEGLWHMMDEGMPLALLFGHLPWLFPWYLKIFGGAKLVRHALYGRKRALKRAQEGSIKKDLYYYLGDEGNANPSARPSLAQVVNDGGLAIIAGSDTTSITLSHLFYFLMSHPDIYARLRAEVDRHFPPGEEVFDAKVLSDMELLNAVIQETLRLYPPLMSGSQRTAEPGQGGLAICGQYLPKGTKAFVHTYTIHRDPRYFSPAPENFYPDRWLSKSNKIDDPSRRHYTAAYIPFSFGPAICVGKNLAQQEMRMTVALLVQRFHFNFAPGWDSKQWEANLRDLYVTMRGPLMITVRSRALQSSVVDN